MKEMLRPVNLVRSEYQPNKAELEKPIDIRWDGGTLPTPDEIARVAFRPVSVKWKHRPE